ncbi:Uncharacterized protein C18orf63 [Anthophora quadrimaculata]
MDTCNLMYERKEQTVVYASFPQISELCCAICETDFIEVHDSSSKSNYHWQTIKCRLLIHLISDVIASPVSGTERLIFVIANKKYFETGKLERILKNFKLVYQGLRSVTTELYKICLIYTIQTKLAPFWNKVGDYFVQGKEFYNFIEGIKAVKLEILIKGSDICLQLYTNEVKIPYIKLEDYLSPSVISQFLADPKGYINLSHYNFPFVYVLPSTKKGKLLSVSKEIPARSVFKDYDQLRRHWKNMYGYSLPKNESSILYYEIKFLIPRSKIFTYPNLCVASGPLNVIPNRDKEHTITDFLSDILTKVPATCGKQLQISKYTPFNSTFSNINLSPDVLLKNEKLHTHLKEMNNNTSKLEFSTTYMDKLTTHTNTTSTTLKTQFAKIHQIHNILPCENVKTDSNNQNISHKQEDSQCSNAAQNLATQSIQSVCTKNNMSRNLVGNCTFSKEETISKHFKIQKLHTLASKGEPTQEEEQNHLTLKEKLSKAISHDNNKPPLKETDQNINVEIMARNNQLDQIKNSVLSDWLKRHSIPHNSKAKKTELINKILSHMKNTQILQQFRI